MKMLEDLAKVVRNGGFHGKARDFIRTHHDTIADMAKRLEAAESECLEQARLNGMGSEREAALMARIELANAEISSLKSAWHVETMIEKDRIIALQEDHNDELKSKLEAAERDAARYRWFTQNAEIIECKKWHWWKHDSDVTPIADRIDADMQETGR